MTTNEERAAMLEGFADDLDGPNWRGMAEALRAGAEALRAAPDHQAEAPSGPAYIGNMPPVPESDRAWFTVYCHECGIEEGMARHPEAQMLVDKRDAHNRWHAAHPVVDDAMADRLIDIVWSSPNRIAARAALLAALTPDGQEKNE